MRRADSGTVLLEAVVALAILSITGTALASAAIQLLRSETDAAILEREVLREDQLLAGLSLLTREELDLRLGTRTLGAFTVRIARTRPMLYRVGVRADRQVPDDELVVVLYRPRTGTP